MYHIVSGIAVCRFSQKIEGSAIPVDILVEGIA